MIISHRRRSHNITLLLPQNAGNESLLQFNELLTSSWNNNLVNSGDITPKSMSDNETK